jgi:hypothetical protein
LQFVDRIVCYGSPGNRPNVYLFVKIQGANQLNDTAQYVKVRDQTSNNLVAAIITGERLGSQAGAVYKIRLKKRVAYNLFLIAGIDRCTHM